MYEKQDNKYTRSETDEAAPKIQQNDPSEGIEVQMPSVPEEGAKTRVEDSQHPRRGSAQGYPEYGSGAAEILRRVEL